MSVMVSTEMYTAVLGEKVVSPILVKIEIMIPGS